MRIRRLLQGHSRALAVLCAVALCGTLAAAEGRAAEADIFTVRGVDVDVTAETAAAAREQALAEGHVLALRRLFARLLLQEDLARAPDLPASQIAPMVQDFGVDDERTSDVRYLATLTFRFKPDAVRELLRQSGLAHAETQSKPVAVVPVYGAAGEAKLWEDDNPWRQAWTQRPSDDGLVPLVVPLGDLGDIAALDVGQALAGDRQAIAALARRYGAEDALVAQAVLEGDPLAGGAKLQVGTTRIGGESQQTVIDNYTQQPDEDLAALLARAADAVDQQIQEAWKRENLLRLGSHQVLEVTVPHDGLREWLEVKRRLRGVAAVQRSEVTAVSRGHSELRLTFAGSENQLARAMAQSDLALAPAAVGGGWQLRLAEAPASAAQQPMSRQPMSQQPMSQGMPQAMPESAPETMPQSMPQSMPESMPETMPESMPQSMAEPMPETAPEAMPAPMPAPTSDGAAAPAPSSEAPTVE